MARVNSSGQVSYPKGHPKHAAADDRVFSAAADDRAFFAAAAAEAYVHVHAPFDPAEHTVDEVNRWLELVGDDDRQRVLDREVDTRHRVGVLRRWGRAAAPDDAVAVDPEAE